MSSKTRRFVMNPIQRAIQDLTISDKTSYKNLTVVPLLGRDLPEPRYLTLAAALEKGWIQIREVGAGGSVPELDVQNDADLAVLLLDGEELVGAKQNRVLNLSVLVPAGKTIRIPVSCVEAGRWRHVSPTFRDSDRAQFARGRAKRSMCVSLSLLRSGRPSSDQGEVWSEIDQKMARMGAHSPTGAMAAFYDLHRHGLGDYVSQFPLERDQVGAVFGVGSSVLGMELFDSPAVFRKLFPKILRSYAIEALEIQETDVPSPDLEAAETFLRSVSDARVETYPAVGLGTTLRIDTKGLAGGGLAWEERLVHAAAFAV